MKKARVLIALLLTFCMVGTAVSCLADAERVCNSNGVAIVEYSNGQGGYEDKPLQGTTLNDDVTSTGGQASLIGSDGAASALNSPNYSSNPVPAASELTVNGDVSCEAGWIAGGAKAVADSGKAEVTVNGDADAVSYADKQAYNDVFTGQSGVKTASDAYGAAAHSSGTGSEAIVTVTGNVSAEAKERAGYDTLDINAQGVLVTATAGGTSEVTVGGNVSAKSDRSAEGVDIRGYWGAASSGESHIEVNIGGSVTAEGKQETTGLSMGTYDTNSNSEDDWLVNITGDVKATTTAATKMVQGDHPADRRTESSTAAGVSMYSDNGTAEAIIGGNVISNGAANAVGADLHAEEQGAVMLDVAGKIDTTAADIAMGATIETWGNSNTVLSAGSVSATSKEGVAWGVQSNSGNGGTTKIDIEGAVSANAAQGINASGVGVNNMESRTDVKIGNGITVTGNDMAVGLSSNNSGGSTNINEITGGINVTANGNAVGIYLDTNDKDDNVSAKVKGNITAQTTEKSQNEESNIEGVGLNLCNHDGEIDVQVTGNITADGGDAKGININNSLGFTSSDHEPYDGPIVEDEFVDGWENPDGSPYKVYYNAKEDFYYDSNGEMWTETKQTAEDYEGGTTSVKVIGDVKSDVNGIVMDLENEKIKTNVLVDGTVSAEEHSIVLLNEQGIDNMTLTVWKVEANENGSLIETYDEDADTYTRNEKAEKNIQYIIRIDPDQKDIIKTQGTSDYEGYNVAKEGETVTLKVDVPQGYKIKNAFSDSDQTIEMAQDDDGNYYLIVPKGGAVMISVEFEKIPDPDPDPEPQLEIQTAVETVAETNEETKTQTFVQTTKTAIMKPAEETVGTIAFKELIENTDIMSILPDDIKAQLPEGISTVAAAITMTLDNYDESMGAVTLKISPNNKTYTKGEKATIVIALPDENGGYIYFYIEGEGQEDGTLSLNIPADTAKALAGKTFVTMILE